MSDFNRRDALKMSASFALAAAAGEDWFWAAGWAADWGSASAMVAKSRIAAVVNVIAIFKVILQF